MKDAVSIQVKIKGIVILNKENFIASQKKNKLMLKNTLICLFQSIISANKF